MFKDSCDSLGTKALSENNSSRSSNCVFNDEKPPRVSSQNLDAETVPVTFSDVSFFRSSFDEVDSDHALQYTLAIIKPEAVQLMYKIECIIEQNGFIIKTKDVLRLTKEQVATFYDDHAFEFYFPRLVDHISRGPIVVYVLAKKNCIEEWRQLIGPADVSFAKRYFPVSLRAIYGTESGTAPVANAFHGSDSPVKANKEIRFFFPNSEIEVTDNMDDMVQYIDHFMMPTIAEGLSEMFKIYPCDTIRWFGNWLLAKSVQKDSRSNK